MSLERCRSCGAPIFWAKTERGKSMPLDEEPVDPGTQGVFVLRDDLALSVPAGAFPQEPNYVSHFATCPQADRWRKPRSV